MARYAKICPLSFAPLQKDGLEFDPERYKKKIIEYLTRNIERTVDEKPDLVILPEASNRPVGLSIAERNTYYAASAADIEDVISSLAKKHNTNIAFACIREEKNPEDKEFPLRNSVIYYDRKGDVAGIYDKCFLVPTEHTVTRIGFGKIPDKLIELDFGNVATAICFDMHDMALMERYASLSPHLISFSSNFRATVWADVWAKRCNAYFAAALGIELHRGGRIINPFGEVLSMTDSKRYAVAKLNFDFRVIHEDDNQDWRTNKLADAEAKYGMDFNYSQSGRGIGLSLIQSDIPDKTVDDVIKEFGIIETDEYFGEVRELRRKYFESLGK